MRSRECAVCKDIGTTSEIVATRTCALTQNEDGVVDTIQYAVSLLDPADRRSDVHQSVFRGFYNLALMCGGIYIFSTYVSNLITSGGLFNPTLFLSVFFTSHFVELVATFVVQCCYSFVAMIPVYMATTSLRKKRVLINTAQHFFQSILFTGTISCIMFRNWNTVHAISAFLECAVLLMKMHSYTRTQLEIMHKCPMKQSWRSFALYLMFPTLVYKPFFPRTNRIRIGYLVEKSLALILAMALFYLIVTDHVLPALEESGLENPITVIVRLLLPFVGCYLMTWFIIFECICNGFAEITYFAKRDFYSDWWNSTTFDEFARTWNRPVHEFLLRHVYLEGLQTYKMTKKGATVCTFLLSSALHECVFVIVFRSVKLYFFVLQMLHVSVIMYGRGLKGTRLGNFTFWSGMILGLPLQAVLYCREYHGGDSVFLYIMVPVMAAGFGGLVIISIYNSPRRDSKS
ncbi:unnamed protein product [Albugo candida]|uniref:O-acyltransferase n=1 Tax=Albugo candida TaxID=65357 RepID=A0A024GIV7_9STRA|nr:unnamed protein product [Albugo candida]|eukprot:CCI46279.1 unnamed protein product [Albugo candida]